MLSILCSTLWGKAGGFSVGVFVGGMMMQGKHKYKREDVKKDKLEKWYLNYLKEKVYPNLDKAEKQSEDALTQIRLDLKGTATIDQLRQLSEDLSGRFPELIITTDSLLFFQRFEDLAYIESNDTIDSAKRKMRDAYDKNIGKLTITTSNIRAGVAPIWTKYSGIGQVWQEIAQKADQDSNDKRTLLDNTVAQANAAAKAAQFKALVVGPGALADADLNELTRLAGLVTDTNLQTKADLQAEGNRVIDKWVLTQVTPIILSKFNRDAIGKLLQFDDAIEEAKAAYAADQAKTPTADQYDPDGKGKALTSPLLDGAPPGEQDNWETLSGEAKSKRIGLTYGFSVGYEKEMNKNHAFVGGNAFAKKDNLTIKYDLQVDKGNRASFGELEAKPGYTFGVTVIAGKHLNPVFSVFGRGTFEFTKWGFTYDMTNDSPKIADEKTRVQKLGNWVKQAAVGVGARYNFSPLWSVEVCYDFVPATKTTVRDFNKLGDDNRRRGYIYTASQHRVFLKVVRFF